MFETPYADVDLPFWLGLGNHDYGGDGASTEPEKAQVQVDYTDVSPSGKWKMPAHYYRRTDQHVEFFTLDTTTQMHGMDAQQEEDVSRWLSRSDANWKIALGLHSYRSNGLHGNAGSYDGLPQIPIVNGAGVRDFMEDHVCGKADVHFSAFDHNLQWPQQDTTTCPGTELIVSGAAASSTELDDPPSYPDAFPERGARLRLRRDRRRRAHRRLHRYGRHEPLQPDDHEVAARSHGREARRALRTARTPGARLSA